MKTMGLLLIIIGVCLSAAGLYVLWRSGHTPLETSKNVAVGSVSSVNGKTGVVVLDYCITEERSAQIIALSKVYAENARRFEDIDGTSPIDLAKKEVLHQQELFLIELMEQINGKK